MPVKGYDSVNVPSGLYEKIKDLVKSRTDLGYRSVTEFVAEAVRLRLLAMGESQPKGGAATA
ncbi:MAG: ribbon-helix-helix domain-containing protein [Candidatus Bathyarchaeia archaeon]|jgi:Arc/MetJ-type ribon-helix-helix transcriptional regulator